MRHPPHLHPFALILSAAGKFVCRTMGQDRFALNKQTPYHNRYDTICAVVLSLKDRNPVWIAWSTPGAALLATTGAPEHGFPEAVGAFIICGALIVIAGLLKPLTRAVSDLLNRT